MKGPVRSLVAPGGALLLPVLPVLFVLLGGPVFGTSARAGEAGTEAPAPSPDLRRTVWEEEGIRVEATLRVLEVPASGAPSAPAPAPAPASVPGSPSGFQEGAPVEVAFRVTETTSGEPLSGLFPAAWMDRVPTSSLDGKAAPEECDQKVEAFLGGSLLAEPEVNLNVYYVVALNEDASLTVVDPIFGFGGSKLLAMVELQSPGEDWALTADGRTLFVSMPAVDRVAVVDTSTWKVRTNLEVGARPVRLALQEDERYLWVAAEGAREGFGGPGVTVVDTETLEVVRHLPTGRGPHHLALDDDNRWVFVTDGRDGAVSVVDVRRLEVVNRVVLDGRPVWIAWSPAAQAAYAPTREGQVVAVTADGPEPLARIAAEPGLGRIAFAPDGRLAFVVNPVEDLVHIVDAASNRILQTADVLRAPDQVAFSDELAYVRHAASEIVLMIPLDAVGRAGEPVPVIEFPGGQRPPGEETVPTPAPAILQAPGATAVLVANPADGVIYYYKEGMAAPMGSFRNYDRQPRAVQVVDRSLEEREPGVYSTTVQLRRPGTYDLAVYLDSPPRVHCMAFEVVGNPELERERRAHRVDIEMVAPPEHLAVGEEARLRFRVLDPETGAPPAPLDDLQVLTFLSPGTWQKRQPASPVDAVRGLYEMTFTPPEQGLYYLFFRSASVGMGFNRSPSILFEAFSSTAPPPGGRGGEGAGGP